MRARGVSAIAVAIIIAVFAQTAAQAATVSYLGSDEDRGEGWRSMDISKPAAFDPVSDNAYGSDGYYCTWRSGGGTGQSGVQQSLPLYISGVAQILPMTVYSATSWAALDNPSVPIGSSITNMGSTGWFYKSAGGTYSNFFTITLAEDSDFILSVIFDVTAHTTSNIKIIGPGTTNDTAVVAANATPDFYFFQITGSAGDRFEIWFKGDNNAGCAGFGFESVLSGTYPDLDEKYGNTGLELPNQNLDEDYENDGIPDKWIVPESASVTLVTDRAVVGKAARFDDGYILLQCEMSARYLPGLRVNVSFDAAGEDDARLGVALGYSRKDDSGGEEFFYTRLVWDRELESDYKRISSPFQFPDNAIEHRVVLVIYRSNEKGVVWLDNFKLVSSRNVDLSEKQKKLLVAAERDWRYLAARVEKALESMPEARDELVLISNHLAGVRRRLKIEDLALLETHEEQLQLQNVALNRIMSSGKNDMVWLSDATIRQKTDEVIPAELMLHHKILSLGNEYQAVGVMVANCTGNPAVYPVEIKGLENIASAVTVRRQVFLMNWYEKERELVADPLTMLPRKDETWQLEASPGGMDKLFISFKVNRDVAGIFPITIRVGEQELVVSLEVLNCNLPVSPKLHNMQFIYPEIEPAGSHAELAARDLAEHYTTEMEFPYVPKEHSLNEDGTLASEGFEGSTQFRWAKAYTKYGIRMVIFWAGTYGSFNRVDGTNMPYMDEDRNLYSAWKKGLKELLAEWLACSARNGIGPEHYIIQSVDEVASGADYKNPPGKNVQNAIEIVDVIKQVRPKLPVMTTMTDYALYEDVKAYLPYHDIVMPLWPYRDCQLRHNPQGRNPRRDFYDNILPLLKSVREKRGLQIWSYKIDTGKKEPVLNTSLAYPICAVGLGFTGIGHWSYNVGRGLTWDDTDKGLLDYSTIYNGKEEHPLNKRYNVTKEIIVPSIRWEALRLGIQSGQILLHLKDCLEKGECDNPTASEIRAVLRRAEEYGREMNYTREGIEDISEKVRRLALRTSAGK